jgi:hypothetical protein
MRGHGLDSPVCGWDPMVQSSEDGHEPSGYITKYTSSWPAKWLYQLFSGFAKWSWFTQWMLEAKRTLRAAAYQLRQDKHQDMRQKLTSASWLRPLCGGFHNLIPAYLRIPAITWFVDKFFTFINLGISRNWKRKLTSLHSVFVLSWFTDSTQYP